MSEFHFIRPLWFLALLPCVLLLWQLSHQTRRNSGWQQIIPRHLVNHLIQGSALSKHQPFWLLAMVWTMIVVALAGPSWEKLPQPVYQLNTGKVIVLDMSMSMRSTDLLPDRLTKMRYKAIDLIGKIDDSDMGLIAYAGEAFVISPLTTDSKNLVALIPNLSPEIMPVNGSDPLAGLNMADILLKNAGYSKGEIYLFTDGISQQDMPEVQNFIKNTHHRISVLGIGTPEGAPIKQLSGELLKDNHGAIIIPRLNDASLRQLAKGTGGVYSRITNNEIDIEKLAAQRTVSHEAKKDQDSKQQGDQFKEFGPFLVLLMLPFAAYAFRRGLVVCVVLGFSLTMAQPARADWWQDMWQTQDQQAQQQFSQQNFADAGAMFNDPNWKGSSLYKSGDYEGALAEFQKNTSADALYNQGNAHTQLKDLDAAIDAYEQALAKDPSMEDAKKNLELVKKLKEQQEQQKQDQEGQDQQDQQQKDQQDQKDQDDQQDQKKQQGQEKSDQQQDQQSQDQQQQADDDQQPSESRPNDQSKEGDQDPQSRAQKEQEQQQKEQAEKEQQQAQAEQQKDGEKEPKDQQQMQQTDSELTTEQKEQMQEIQQLLRKIPDNPSILLRNKMRQEYQKRKQQQALPPGAKSW